MPGDASLWLAVGAAILFTLLVVWWVARALRHLRAWWSRWRGRRGESLAVGLLMRAGYAIVSEQTERRCRLLVDGEPVDYVVRADFIVEREGRRFVAEAKNGIQAADPRHRATRRQLREYSVVFDAAGVLLIDIPARRIRSIVFDD